MAAVLACAVPSASQARPAGGSAVQEAWDEYARASRRPAAERDAARAALLRDPQAACRHIIDRVWPPSPRAADRLSPEQVRQAIQDLASPLWQTREKATSLLIAQGPDVLEILRSHRSDDVEVNARIELIAAAMKARPVEEPLAGAVTEFLVHHMDPNLIRQAARAAALRIRTEDDQRRGEFLAGPLVASLRCSPDPNDRDLAALVQARNPDSTLLREVLQGGLAGLVRAPAHWTAPPHDCEGALYRLLAPARPEAFLAAMDLVLPDDRLLGRLRDARPQVRDKALAAAIDKRLADEKTAGEEQPKLLAVLAKPQDDPAFEEALSRLTSGLFVFRGTQVVPPLVRAVQSQPEGRKAAAIRALANFRGSNSAMAAAEALWAWACGADKKAAEAAWEAVWLLHEGNGGIRDILLALAARVGTDREREAFRQIGFAGSRRLDALGKQLDAKLAELRSGTDRKAFDLIQRERARVQGLYVDIKRAVDTATANRMRQADEEARKRQELLRQQIERREEERRRAASRPAAAPDAPATGRGREQPASAPAPSPG